MQSYASWKLIKQKESLLKKYQGYSFAQANLLCSDSSKLEGTNTILEQRTAVSHEFAKVELGKQRR